MADDPYPCPLCGRPRPWETWFSKDGKGCRHPERTTAAASSSGSADTQGATDG